MQSAAGDYQSSQRRATLTKTVWAVVAATFFFGFFNLNLADLNSAVAIFLASGVCLLALLANIKNYYTLAALMVCASVLLTITYSVIDGDGLFDPGIVGYPLFILLGTLLLSKRYTLWLALAALLSLGLVTVFQANGQINVTVRANDPSNLLPIGAFLVTAALIVWVILDNLDKHLEKISASEQALRESYALTIEGWAKALELRDGETARHSKEVVQLCVRLGGAMGLSKAELEQVYYGAHLHDIGKLAIRDGILLKPGPLSPEEWEVMRTHPAMAKSMLEAIPYLRGALAIPYGHHERWDGSGYPQGLRGEDIPLAARIFAVVDVWDALTNDRPYRKAWSPEQTRAYIIEQSGKQFDPAVVEKFLRLV